MKKVCKLNISILSERVIQRKKLEKVLICLNAGTVDMGVNICRGVLDAERPGTVGRHAWRKGGGGIRTGAP